MQDWYKKYLSLVERSMAVAVSNGDLSPFKIEMEKLLSIAPANFKDELSRILLNTKKADKDDGTASGSISTDDSGQGGTASVDTTGGNPEQQLNKRRRSLRRTGQG